MITGLAVMGFGLGAAIMGQLAPFMISGLGIPNTFYASGLFFLAVMLIAAQQLINPPKDYALAQTVNSNNKTEEVHLTFADAIKMPQFYILWTTLFINITAGIALISNLSPLAQSQVGLTAVTAGTLVFVTALFNGFGRLFWSMISDKIGRKNTFLLIIATQVPLFLVLPMITNVWLFGLLCCWIFLCYGGGFGTMPSFAADTFGSKNIGGIYGPILTAWGMAAIVGRMIMEYVKQSSGNFSMALTLAGSFLVVGVLVVMLYRRPQLEK